MQYLVVIFLIASADYDSFYISENSQVANARFQAAAAIKDAAIREWGFLSPDDKRNLIRLYHVYMLFMFFTTKNYLYVSISLLYVHDSSFDCESAS